MLPFGASIAPAVLIVGLLLFGLGTGFASPGIMAAGLGAAPSERAGYAAGMLSTSRYIGSIAASVLVSMFVSDNGGGARTIYSAAVVALVFAMAASRGIPGRLPLTLHADARTTTAG